MSEPPPKKWVQLQYMRPGSDDVADDTIECNLAGINHLSLTGEHRQANIQTLEPGQSLILIRHTDNEYDENAVLVVTQGGKDVGYLPAHVAEDVAPILDRKRAVTVVVESVEEFVSSSNNRLLGVRLILTPYKPERAKRKPKGRGH